MNWALIAAGLIGAMILAVIVVNAWINRRRRLLVEAGARIGLAPLTTGRKLIVPMVPLIDRPDRRYRAILVGALNGREGAFFDLFVTSGELWTLQSTVLLRDSEVDVPMFQLRTPNWNKLYQRVRGDSVDIPGREHEMQGLKLTSNDPDWARKIFSQASAEFLEKVRRGRWTIEGLEQYVVVYQWLKRIPPRRLGSYVQQAAELGNEMLSMCRPSSGFFT